MSESVGGQAVIEGVLIRGKKGYGIAVRDTKGKIVTKKGAVPGSKSKAAKAPFIRGIYQLFISLKLGLDALSWSANASGEEEEELSKKEIWGVVFISVFFSIVIFTLLPYLLASISFQETASPILFNTIDSLIKIFIFASYIFIISRMPDVKRMFEYHGAEHKVVNCHEAGKTPSVKNAKMYPKEHKRCGTNFIMLVFIVSILVFSVLPVVLPLLMVSFSTFSPIIRKLVLFIFRLASIPLIASLSYEVLKGASKMKEPFSTLIATPGLLMQKMTTYEPDDEQIEVALKALGLVTE